MSLAVLADHMASKGRGPDSMLIHMSPREVQGLQALAMRHGGSLTINPDTGLPEAGILDKLLPAVLGFALGPAGFALATPMQAAMVVGGIQAARTGDIGKGLQAGLGAYGGAGLGAGISEAGASSIGAGEAAKGLTMTPDLANELMNAGAGETAAATNNALQQQVAAKMASATPFEKLSAGADAFKDNPMGMTKSLSSPLMMAAAPILADQSVKSNLPTTTTKPGMIRPYAYDPYGGSYTPGIPYEATPTKFAQGGLMGLAAGGMAGYGDGDDVPRRVDNGMAQGGMYEFAQRSEPVLRMAEGGIAGYAAGGAPISDPAIAQILADAARLRGATASTAPAQAVAVPGVVDTTKPGQYVTDPATGNAVALSAYSPGFDPNNKIAQTYLGELAAKGGTDTTSQMFNQMGASQAQKDANAAAWATEKARLDALDAAKAPTGLAGLNQNNNLLTNQNKNLLTSQDQNAGLAALANIPNDASYTNQWFAQRGLGFDPIDRAIDNFFAEYTDDLALMTPKAQEKVMRDALATERMNEADVVRATGKTIAQLIQQKRADGSIIVPGKLEEVPVGSLPGGVSGAGITDINANGTITTRPDIPGIPDGGFTGMRDVRNAYTEGGGSLGYIPYAPKTIKEFEDRYKLTGGSKAAYDYLMGRTPYDPIPYTKTGEIMKPYFESVGRAPVNLSTKKYLFKDGKYVLNPDYVKPPYVLAAEKAAAEKEANKTAAASGKSIQVTDYNGESPQTYTAVLQGDGTYLAGNGKRYDEAGKELAAGGGLMAMARGGSTQYDLGDYSDGGRLLRGPGDGVSDSIPASIGNKRPARLADGEFVVPARIVSELGNGSTEAGARKLYAMMDRIQAARRGTVGKGKVAKNSRADKHLPA